MRIVKPIPKFDGYFISDEGIVYSNKTGKMKELSVGFIESSSGLTYKYVQLYKNGRVHTKTIHRIVHSVFNSSNSQPFHIDGNCFNNHYKNLTDKLKDYELQEGETWLNGFENRYFLCNGEIYSVYKKDYPTRLKPYFFLEKKKYSLVKPDGKTVSYYL